VSKHDSTRKIAAKTVSLERARRVCATLRQEGSLAQVPCAVLLLANRLLESLKSR
jgi:hypothetical protein